MTFPQCRPVSIKVPTVNFGPPAFFHGTSSSAAKPIPSTRISSFTMLTRVGNTPPKWIPRKTPAPIKIYDRFSPKGVTRCKILTGTMFIDTLGDILLD